MKNDKYFDIPALLPHEPPMVVIDRVMDYDLENGELTAEVELDESNMFYDCSINAVPAFLGIEYMAQSIGALSGIAGMEAGLSKPDAGFVLGTRKYHNSVKSFALGVYAINVKQIFTDTELSSFSCTITDSLNKVCATADLNVFKPKDFNTFLEILNG